MGEGLWRVRHESLGKVEAIEKTRISGARTIFEDREGNIWAGAGDGLVRLRKPPVRPLENLGLVEAVATTADGRVWAATADGLLALTLSPTGNRDEQRSLTGMRVRAIRTDRMGTLWAATDAGLLHLSDRPRWYRPATASGVLGRVSALAPDGQGGLWLAYREGGASRWHPRQPDIFETVPALTGVRAAQIFSDHAGRLWFASTAGRVGRVEANGSVRSFGPDDGLHTGNYTAIYEDSRGVIWLGAFDGLYRMVGNRFVRFDQANRFRGGVAGIVDDTDGDLWLATASGIVLVTRQALDESLRHPGIEVRTSVFDQADGTAGMPISFGGPSVARASDGRLWFVTGRGLTSLEPSILKRPRTPALAKIESIQVDEHALPATPAIQLPPQTNRLQIDYTALDLTTSLRTRFKYRLEGFDAEWIDAGTRRHALYTHLPPRQYRFHVVASTSDGSWSDTAAAWDFSIRPRFYQTYWFATLSLLAAGVGTWTIWRLHVRRIRRQFAVLIGERVRLSRDLHDTLLQSLVGVALQFDGVASGLDAGSPVRAQLVRIRKQVEEYIREARASIWHLRMPRLESGDLASALRESAERAATGTPVQLDFSFHAPAGRSPEDTDEQLLRICHEAVLNAVRHADASRVTVTLRYDDDTIVLRIADNGHGFNPGANAETGENGHYGLVSMRERAEQVGGHLSLTTAPNEGTVVEARVPLRA